MSTAQPYTYIPGTIPLLVNMPHTATDVPTFISERFTAAAKPLPDTDWHIEKLYSFARELGVHLLIPKYSRYVVDLNRSPDNESLYPGKFTTGICPLTTFTGEAVYEKNREPDEKEIKQRVADYWQPYHDKLQSILDTLKQKHKQVILFDAHSICSVVPKLFDGVLPDLNIGTADGHSADSILSERFFAAAKASSYSVVYNGRFKGGYNTRHYGKPGQGVHAVQLELAQHNYMDENYPFTYDTTKAKQLQAVLRKLLTQLIQEI